jgi:hypothetical protein
MQRRVTRIVDLLTRGRPQDAIACPDCEHPLERESEANLYWLASLVGVPPISGPCEHEEGDEAPCRCLSYSHRAP